MSVLTHILIKEWNDNEQNIQSGNILTIFKNKGYSSETEKCCRLAGIPPADLVQ